MSSKMAEPTTINGMMTIKEDASKPRNTEIIIEESPKQKFNSPIEKSRRTRGLPDIKNLNIITTNPAAKERNISKTPIAATGHKVSPNPGFDKLTMRKKMAIRVISILVIDIFLNLIIINQKLCSIAIALL